jgi:hypothetical protein
MKTNISLFFRAPLVAFISVIFFAGLAFGQTFAVFGPKKYVRDAGSPVTRTDTFTVSDLNVSYTLRVTNSRTRIEEDDPGTQTTNSGTIRTHIETPTEIDRLKLKSEPEDLTAICSIPQKRE